MQIAWMVALCAFGAFVLGVGIAVAHARIMIPRSMKALVRLYDLKHGRVGFGIDPEIDPQIEAVVRGARIDRVVADVAAYVSVAGLVVAIVATMIGVIPAEAL